MKPQFPKFQRLTIRSKHVLEPYTRPYPPYSDYYFFSLWSYNTNNQVLYSFLHGNLVIKFQEYSGNGYFYSFLGTRMPDETIRELLEEAQKKKLPQVLKLVPQSNFIRTPADPSYTVREDADNADYIFSVDKLIHLTGKRLHQKKKQLKKFMELSGFRAKYYSLKNTKIHRELSAVLRQWYVQTTSAASKNSVELAAIRRAMRGAKYFNLKAMFVWVDGKPRGFTIFEQVSAEYAVLSFQKADKSYPGIFEFMNHDIAGYLSKRGVLYMNMEQDLGIPGLRQAKRKYDPTYLTKYIITPK